VIGREAGAGDGIDGEVAAIDVVRDPRLRVGGKNLGREVCRCGFADHVQGDVAEVHRVGEPAEQRDQFGEGLGFEDGVGDPVGSHAAQNVEIIEVDPRLDAIQIRGKIVPARTRQEVDRLAHGLFRPSSHSRTSVLATTVTQLNSPLSFDR